RRPINTQRVQPFAVANELRVRAADSFHVPMCRPLRKYSLRTFFRLGRGSMVPTITLEKRVGNRKSGATQTCQVPARIRLRSAGAGWGGGSELRQVKVCAILGQRSETSSSGT